MADYIERIKQLKKERNITTEQLARDSGVPVGTLSKILSGVADSVKLSNIASVCSALGVSLDYLVFGIPENKHNYTLNPDEMDFIEDFRSLDVYGRDFIKAALKMEISRAANGSGTVPEIPKNQLRLKLNVPTQPAAYTGDALRQERRRIPLFDLPVSAGTGEYLDSAESDVTVRIPAGAVSDRADYAIRISGHSMEPKFRDGDVLLVEKTETVDVGDLCIYTLNDCGYFKVFGGDCLISLNPEFGKIMLKDFDTAVCCGRVLGKLKKSGARK